MKHSPSRGLSRDKYRKSGTRSVAGPAQGPVWYPPLLIVPSVDLNSSARTLLMPQMEWLDKIRPGKLPNLIFTLQKLTLFKNFWRVQ